MARRPPAVARVLERVAGTVRREDLFEPGDRILVAVSGGPDSVCLLESLVRLRRLLRISLEVFHYDHRLRPDSADDASYVRRLAARHRLAFHPCAAHDAPPRGASVEEWARDHRRSAAVAVLNEIGGTALAWGHTVDDQAETVLMRILEGGGLDSLTAIRPRSGVHTRPLLDVTREEVEGFCRALRMRPRRDPTNRSTRYLRNALRLEVLPAIEEATGRQVRRPLARSAALLARDSDELRAQAETAARRLLGRRSLDRLSHLDEVRIAAGPLRTLSPAIGTRAISVVLRAAGCTRVTNEDLESVLDLAAGRPGRSRDLSGGLLARRVGSYIVLVRTSPQTAPGGTGYGPSDH
ncbi:MAG: tRNA lysidine(34) synthetase TilS [Actinomycetota bacterium]